METIKINPIETKYVDAQGNELVAVVRCKDCLEFKYCLHNEHNDTNGFCAWGERREDAETN